MENLYVEPRLAISDTLNDAEATALALFGERSKATLNSCLEEHYAFVVGEAGFGKTRLLKELSMMVSDLRAEHVNLAEYDADLSIEEWLTTEKHASIGFDTIAGNVSQEATDPIRLEYLFADALDEATDRDLPKIIKRLADFRAGYPSVHIFVSCREAQLKRHIKHVEFLQFRFIRILSFSRQQIRQFLLTNGWSEENVSHIFGKMDRPGHHWAPATSILEVPRYLQMYCQLLSEREHTSCSKPELFEHFVRGKLSLEENRHPELETSLVRGILGKLALVMEISQKSTITKDQFISFLDNVSSNIAAALLGQVPLKVFYTGGVLRDDGDSLAFENAEFQEYLAAAELVSLGRTTEIIYDLMVVPELNDISPSWLNVLSFAIELDPSLLGLIFEYLNGQRQHRFYTPEIYAFILRAAPEKIPASLRRNVFRYVLDYYASLGQETEYQVQQYVSLYYDDSLEPYLGRYVDARVAAHSVRARRMSVAGIVQVLGKHHMLSSENRRRWVKQLRKWIGSSGGIDNPLCRRVLHALASMKADSVLNSKAFGARLQNAAPDTKREYLRILWNSKPYNTKAMGLLARAIEEDIDMNHALGRLDWQTDRSEHLVSLFKCLANSNDFLLGLLTSSFFSYSSGEEQPLVESVRNNYCPDLQEAILRTFSKAYSYELFYGFRNEDGLIQLAKVCSQENEKFALLLIDSVAEQVAQHSIPVSQLLGAAMTKENVASVVEKAKEIKYGSRIAFEALLSARERKEGEQIFKSGQQLLKKEYEEYIQQTSRHSQADEARKHKLYAEFRKLLAPGSDKFNTYVFHFLLNTHKEIESMLTEQDLARTVKLACRVIDLDYRSTSLNITEIRKDGCTYTTSRDVHCVGDAIKVLALLSPEVSTLSRIRPKLWEAIPYCYPETVEAILQLAPNPTSSDIDGLVRIYVENREDDLSVFMPENFVKLCESSTVAANKAVEPLKKIVSSTQVRHDYVRIRALDTLVSLGLASEQYLTTISRKPDSLLHDRIIHWLIVEYGNVAAIQARVDNLIDGAFKNQRTAGASFVPREKSELYDRDLAKPLMQLNSPDYMPFFEKLLAGAIATYGRGHEYSDYAFYLWDIVYSYFDNLKSSRDYSYLDQLRLLITQHLKENGGWLLTGFARLKRSYMLHIEPPETFLQSVHTYNRIKDRQHLRIRSSRELLEVVKDAIETDLRSWVEMAGAYSFLEHSDGKQEDLIQKTLTTQLENSLLKRGIRDTDIIREAQKFDNERPDFLVSYGFLPPIMIEAKRTNNAEVTNKKKREEYRAKMIRYMEGQNTRKAEYGVYLLFQTNTGSPLEKYLPLVEAIYEKDENISVMGLDCTPSCRN